LWGDTVYLKEKIHAHDFPKKTSKYSKNIYLVRPIYFIPFRRFKFIEKLNFSANLLFLRFFTEIVYILRKCRKRVFWIFDPNLSPIYKYFGKKYFLLYDCVDFFGGHDEQWLCKKADLVVVNSHILQNHLQKFRKNVKLVPQGFRILDFAKKKYKHTVLKLKKPVIGFVGGVNKRLNFDLLLRLIKHNSKWNFVIWGPIQKWGKSDTTVQPKIKEILSLINVTAGESWKKEEIPEIISQFDIGIIPYDISQNFNKYCYPAKLFEYFYLGKPVISTPIEELKQFPNYVKTENNYKDWERTIKHLLSKPWPEKYKHQEKRLAIENSWQRKIEEILKYCNPEINSPKKDVL
jgi:glycosyltransferase involved in cell wall biosynthesis